MELVKYLKSTFEVAVHYSSHGVATEMCHSRQVVRILLFTDDLHIQIPLNGYVGPILRSTAVPTTSRITFEGTMGVL